MGHADIRLKEAEEQHSNSLSSSATVHSSREALNEAPSTAEPHRDHMKDVHFNWNSLLMFGWGGKLAFSLKMRFSHPSFCLSH